MAPTAIPTIDREPESITLTSKAKANLYRGTALSHQNGDIYVIVGLIWLRPTGIRPELHSVMLERTRDSKNVEKLASVIREQIEKETLRYAPRFNDSRMSVRLDVTEVQTETGMQSRLEMHTID